MRVIVTLSLLGLFAEASCVSPEAKTVRAASSAASALTIQVGNQTRRFSSEELLRSPFATTIAVDSDPAYANRKISYLAIPLARLFESLPVDRSGTMLFHCLDGFSAPIATAKILNLDRRESIAYLAIEKPGEKWPPLKAGEPNKTAGPFYLVWEHPEKSKIAIEEWPYQLAGFEQKPSLESQFPHAAPDPSIAATSPVRAGYGAFMKNCFPCHTMNGEGASQVGPDLNLPHNPTEYLKPDYFALLVRNPQSLRRWPESKMRGFNQTELSDEDLRNISAYLKHMARRKVAP